MVGEKNDLFACIRTMRTVITVKLERPTNRISSNFPPVIMTLTTLAPFHQGVARNKKIFNGQGRRRAGVIKKYNEIYRPRKTLRERSLRHRGQKVSPLRFFRCVRILYYSTCCSDTAWLINSSWKRRRGGKRAVLSEAARYLKVERGCYRYDGYFCLFRFIFLLPLLVLIIVIFLLLLLLRFKMETVYRTDTLCIAMRRREDESRILFLSILKLKSPPTIDCLIRNNFFFQKHFNSSRFEKFPFMEVILSDT